MDKNGLVEKILELEWPMFSGVNNAGGKAACQMDPDTFRIMRTSQYNTWKQDVLQSYLNDLEAARAQDRNFMTEKYARMMETTFPEEYARIADSLPPLEPEAVSLVEEIVAIHVGWKEALDQKYPHLADRGRPIRTCDDRMGLPSVETYTRAELQTYSVTTLRLYRDSLLERVAQNKSEAEENLANQVRQYGYSDPEAAERHFALQE